MYINITKHDTDNMNQQFYITPALSAESKLSLDVFLFMGYTPSESSKVFF